MHYNCRSRVVERILASRDGRLHVGSKEISDHERNDKYHPQEGFSYSGHHTTVHQHGVEEFRCGRPRRHSRKHHIARWFKCIV